MTSRSIARWYLTLPPIVPTFVSATGVFFALWSGAVVERQVQEFTSLVGWAENMTYFVVLFVAVLLFVIARTQVRTFLGTVEQENEERKETLSYAASLVEQDIAKQVETSAGKLSLAVKTLDKRLVVDAFATVERTRTIVEAAYHLFEARYGESNRIIDNVEFEVTFMTKSYADGGITIPAFANRARRAPRSMLQRSGNPTLYDGTVTARCYRDAAPQLCIVEDTKGDSYVELYSDQKKRIRSSIIAPVLSHNNEMLGTLVVHCDRAKFFLVEDARFWGKVTEKFTPHLALEKTRLDYLFSTSQVWELLALEIPNPPF